MRGGKGKKIVLIGHLDTVFEKDHPFQTFKREGDKAYGPGVADMKRGSSLLRDLNRSFTLLEEVKCSSFFCKWDLMAFPGWQARLPLGDCYSVPVLTHKDLISKRESLDLIAQNIFSAR